MAVCRGSNAGPTGNELISEGCDLLLLDLLVGKVLLILLPVRTGSGRLCIAVRTSENGWCRRREPGKVPHTIVMTYLGTESRTRLGVCLSAGRKLWMAK